MHGDKTTSQNLSRCSKKHRHKKQFLKDTSQKQEINRFSEESQQFLVDMNSTDIFELYENCAKLQCLDCNSFADIGIMYCSCGRILKYYNKNQKANDDYFSILGFAIKKNSTREPKHGQSERQIVFFKAKEMLKKARQPKHGGHPTILERWYADKRYRGSLAEHDTGEKENYASRSQPS